MEVKIMFGIEVLNNVAYGSLPGETMDIFLPKGATAPTGIFEFIHGGGFIGGSAKQGEPLWNGGNGQLHDLVTGFVARHGEAYVSINYPLATLGEKEPNFATDAAAVEQSITFLEANAAKYNLDTSHISLIGESAGAMLATYTAETDPRIANVVDCFGPVDENYGYDPRIEQMLCAEFGSDPSYRTACSPLDMISKSATHKAPVMIVQGSKDLGMPPKQSAEYYHMLCADGYHAYWHPYDGGHSFAGTPAKTIESIEAWIVHFALVAE
jgi:acetyl esterase/lipase